MQNIFAVYKPKGISSNGFLEKIRGVLGTKHIGHAGTLDPLASGVLVIGVGREATKKLSEVVKKEKEYIAKIRLGMESATDDEEGEKTEFKNQNAKIKNSEQQVESKIKTTHPTVDEIKKVLKKFVGKIMQIPPVYSAVKIKGKEAYKRARKGEVLEMKPREVEIKEIEILNYKWPDLELRVVTGPGVYIRSLARDIGKELKVGGYLADLERIRVGDYTKEKVIQI